MSLPGSLPEFPCGPILELKGQRKRFHVPYGLKPLIEEMSMRVLQDQPENIYEYLACFMEARVQMKDELSQSESNRSSDAALDDLSDFLKTIRTSIEEADHYATVIQAAYRGHLAKKLVNDLRRSKEIAVQNHHATVIQAAFRGHLAREKVKELRHSRDSGEYDEEEEGASEYETETEEGEDDEYYDDEEYYDSEEEMETEVEISEMDELAEEVELLTVKSPNNMNKYAVSKTDMGGQEEELEEEE